MCDITISNFRNEAATTVMPLLSAALYLKFRRVRSSLNEFQLFPDAEC